MAQPLKARIEALECQVAVINTVATLIGAPTEPEIERLFDAGIQVIVTIPDNGRTPGGDQWQRSRLE